MRLAYGMYRAVRRMNTTPHKSPWNLPNVPLGIGGSGSTMIACEKNGREARLMELDPKYCDVIVKRWQDFTGEQAKLEGSGELFPTIKGDG